MNATSIVLLATILIAMSGLPMLVFSKQTQQGQRYAVAILVVGCLTGLYGVTFAFDVSHSTKLIHSWTLPYGMFSVGIDAISRFFLFLIFTVPALIAIYGLGYWKQNEHIGNGRQLGLAFGLLVSSLALICIAQDGVLFLLAWEIMALAIFFLVTVEDEKPEVRRAGWVYLVTTHLATLCLFAMFALWRYATGSFAFDSAQGIPAYLANPIFILALLGFGAKAGLMPLHIWLPGAHANAPSHVSGMLSGVVLKIGIYGIVRMTGLLPIHEAWWGGSLLAIGSITAVCGIVYAIAQHDLKRMLAYSSIENVGIIFMGIGLAVYGRYLGHMDWVILGLAGALLHSWNHGLFKTLLFLNSGAIIHAAHTREMDKMGGLGKKMPHSMALFAIGALGICALPPLNGFASEWLVYIGLFRTLGLDGSLGYPALSVGAVALSLVGALAVAGFVKIFSVIYLGMPRVAGTERAKDPGLSMIIPMLMMAFGCIVIGLFSFLTFPLLNSAVGIWSGMPETHISISAFAPSLWISLIGLTLIISFGLAFILWNRFQSKNRIPRRGTWDCGYAAPTARMQYTGSSFGQSLVRFFRFLLWPRYKQPFIKALFPSKQSFSREVPDVILDRGFLPGFHYVQVKLRKLHIIQQGNTHLYILYIGFILLFLVVYGAKS